MSLPATSGPLPAVLLIGDDPAARAIASSMLRHLGVEADAAASGAAGVARAAEQAYDVALVAIPLAGLDAAHAVRALRASGAGRVVALAAHPGSHAESMGFDAAFQMPLSVALLANAIADSAAGPTAALAASGGSTAAGSRSEEPATVARPQSGAAIGADSLMAAVRAHVTALLGEEDEEFVQELAVSFAGSARDAAREATVARAASDIEGIARAAHALKGSASNVGLDTLTEAWSVIEEHARAGHIPDAPLAQAIAETERTVAHLAQ